MPPENLFEETPSEPPPEPSEKPRQETPEQAAIHEAWNAYGLEGLPTEDGPRGKKYGRLMAALQTAGIPKVLAWAECLRDTRREGCPEGAKPMAHFCEAFVAAMKPNAPWTWKRDGGRPRLPTGEFIRRNDGSVELRSGWSFGDELTVDRLKAESNWNPKTGHPIRQAVGFTYSDENPHPEDV
jgi:hypothetical protein